MFAMLSIFVLFASSANSSLTSDDPLHTYGESRYDPYNDTQYEKSRHGSEGSMIVELLNQMINAEKKYISELALYHGEVTTNSNAAYQKLVEDHEENVKNKRDLHEEAGQNKTAALLDEEKKKNRNLVRPKMQRKLLPLLK